MKKYILLTESSQDQFDNLEELKESIIPNYMHMSENDLKDYMYEKMFGFSMLNDLQIVDTKKGVYESDYKIGNKKINIDKAIVIDNMDTYIISLCKYNIIVILEDKDYRYYTKDFKLNREIDRYIAVNEFADSVLNKLVGE